MPKDSPQREHDLARSAAETQAHRQRIAVANGEWRDPNEQKAEAILFKDLVKAFLKHYRPRGGTSAYYEERSKVWLKFFGNPPARAITSRNVQRFVTTRRGKVSPATVKKEVTSLGTCFRWAVRMGYLESNPASSERVERPRVERIRPNPLSQEEEKALLFAIPAKPPTMRQAVRFAIETGMDRSEILALRWSAVDRRGKVIDAPRSKTGNSRRIPYSRRPALKVLLDKAWKARRGPYVFHENGAPLRLNSVKAHVQRAWKKAVPDKTRPWKSLRATFATRLEAAGVRPAVIARLMGLTMAHTLEHYLQPFEEELEAAMAAHGSRAGAPTHGAAHGD